jgi:hypothetical protein
VAAAVSLASIAAAAYFWRKRGASSAAAQGAAAQGAAAQGDRGGGGDAQIRRGERAPLLLSEDLHREVASPRPTSSLN